jgi:6-pyruvoyltetrahydropterin/6-carboxytetrahydropterin synthase
MIELIYREYKLKFYLNAKHYILIDGQKGETHPHTWEIQIYFGLQRNLFIEFGNVEKAINDMLAPYQNRILNDIEPFDLIIPTLENMTDVFAKMFEELLEGMGGKLFSVETAETPTRTYLVRVNNPDRNDAVTENDRREEDSIADEIVERIVGSDD